MTKPLILLLLLLSFYSSAQEAQINRAAKLSCDCLGQLENVEQFEQYFEDCSNKAVAQVSREGSDSLKTYLADTTNRNQFRENLRKSLAMVCYPVRKLFIDYETDHYYRLSNDSLANVYYLKGNEEMEAKDFEPAILWFRKAINRDSSFVMALDHIGYSHRQLDQLDSAKHYYQQSLAVFAAGRTALLNLAVVHNLQENNERSIELYDLYRFLFQDNPEGYFGLSRLLFVEGKYEKALDNFFIAYRMYIETGSPYVEDAQYLLNLMYTELDRKNELALLLNKAKEYGVSLEVD